MPDRRLSNGMPPPGGLPENREKKFFQTEIAEEMRLYQTLMGDLGYRFDAL